VVLHFWAKLGQMVKDQGHDHAVIWLTL